MESVHTDSGIDNSPFFIPSLPASPQAELDAWGVEIEEHYQYYLARQREEEATRAVEERWKLQRDATTPTPKLISQIIRAATDVLAVAACNLDAAGVTHLGDEVESLNNQLFALAERIGK